MASFYVPPRKKAPAGAAFEITAESLDLEGRAVARADGRVYFVPGLLPGERALVRLRSLKDGTGLAEVAALRQASPERVAPTCPRASACGGCPLAHLPGPLSLEAKIGGLRRLFRKSWRAEPGRPDFVVTSRLTGYRRCCRLAVRNDRGQLSLGFREGRSHRLVDIGSCEILTGRLNALLAPLRACLGSLPCRDRIGHVELLDSDGLAGVLLRLTAPLSAETAGRLRAWGERERVTLSVLEPDGRPAPGPLPPKETLLSGEGGLYVLSDGLRILLRPSSFVQVNAEAGAGLAAAVRELIRPRPGMRVLDLYCGAGFFALPLARAGAEVLGVDIAESMIRTARESARLAGLENARFLTADLSGPFEVPAFARDRADAAVLDPGRAGAPRAAAFLARSRVPLIVMVSCNPQSAARDAIELVRSGYTITRWGVLDMFPRTRHIETLLAFGLGQ